MHDENHDEIEVIQLDDIIPKELIVFLADKMKIVAPKNIAQWKVSKALIYYMGADHGNSKEPTKEEKKDIDVSNYDIVTLDTIWTDESEWTFVQ